MRRISTALRLLKKSPREFQASLIKAFSPLFPDKQYLSLMFKCRMGYDVNWDNPKTYSEKLQWLKVYYRNPLYTNLVDKYEVKAIVSGLIGEQYIAKTLGVWKTPQEVDFSALPNQFVLKTSHGGGNSGVIICKDKRTLDEKKVRKLLSKAMRQNLYRDSREWPYKNVRKCIIAEEFLEDNETGELRDYKFFCFNGRVKALFVATERQTREEPYFNFFDRYYNSLDLKQGHPCAKIPPAKPILFEEMIEIAEKLSKNMPHVRIDLYQANGHIYFGEYTFYHFGGMVRFEPEDWDKCFGDWLTLPDKMI